MADNRTVSRSGGAGSAGVFVDEAVPEAERGRIVLDRMADRGDEAANAAAAQRRSLPARN
ncbi:MAG TPA: hypothetical protein VFM13_04725 [Gaiellaceae bacterium]|nr:hypothetical protein [Gaiellaceae bacterium]